MHTPGFDGILNGGDHWSGNKRRVSSGGSFMHRGDLETDAPRDEKALEIKEEEEESSQLLKPDRLSEDNSSHASSSSPSAPSINPPGSDLNEMENVMNDLSVNSRPNSGNHVAGMGLEAGTLGSAPTDLSILASIEWSYLDFSGNIQGMHPTLSCFTHSQLRPSYQVHFGRTPCKLGTISNTSPMTF